MFFDVSHHAGKTVLLLQGPVGPFFARFADYLLLHGTRKVFKVNFNAGDDFFYKRPDTIRFTDKFRELPDFFRRIFAETKPDAVYMFGDCRPVHRTAVEILRERNVDFYVFEEGYLRPHFVTLEKGGVNAYSSLPRRLCDMKSREKAGTPSDRNTGYGHFRTMALYAFLYFAAGYLLEARYPLYRHHKPFALKETFLWARSYLRKWLCVLPDRLTQKKLAGKEYFAVPLQVFCDAQVARHSDFADIRDFIETVIVSFARHAPPNRYLVVKHHPMDRGHRHYGRLIRSLCSANGVKSRVFYIHEANLPGLLKGACGTIVINSTLGLSSLHHNTPVKVLGRAFYDTGGLTYQGSLERFWRSPGKVNAANYRRMRSYVLEKTQIAGSFYDPQAFAKAEGGESAQTGLYPRKGIC